MFCIHTTFQKFGSVRIVLTTLLGKLVLGCFKFSFLGVCLVKVKLVAFIFWCVHGESQLTSVSPLGFPTGPDETVANAGQKQRH